jgi:hypothetical protein
MLRPITPVPTNAMEGGEDMGDTYEPGTGEKQGDADYFPKPGASLSPK